MPITYQIEPDSGDIYVAVTGSFTTEEIISSLSQATAAPQFRPGCNILSDHRQIEIPITPQQLTLMIEHLRLLESKFRFSRWAIVATQPASYGMMRMFAVYAEPLPLEIKVFRDYDAAQNWLNQSAGSTKADS